jgi:leucyl-tRNA synthetase
MARNNTEYKFVEIEKFWQDYWIRNGIFTTKVDILLKKFYDIFQKIPYLIEKFFAINLVLFIKN